MTLPSSPNSISFGQIEAEFGQNPGRSLGQYRRQDPSRITAENPTGLLENSSPSTGLQNSAINLLLDDGIPNSGEIRFSQFRGKQLNMIVDYYADRENLNKDDQGDNTMAASWRYLNQSERVKVVGGFRGRPIGSVNSNYVLSSSDWQGGKKIIVHVNQTVGGKKDGDVTDVALRTGVWPTGTNLSVTVGPSGYLTGAGGDGGVGGSYDGGDGGNGTSALGVEYPAIVSVAGGGVIRCGYGGGGGGSGAANDPSDKSVTDFGRSGAGGGGGAGLPAGAGGGGGSGGFNGSNTPPAGPINGTPGFAGDKEGGGQGGDAGATGGATGGDGGAGGDFEAAAEDGVRGVRADDRAYRNTPGDEGSAGSDGKAIYFSSSSVANSSDIDAANVGGRNGGTATGSIN